jgi:hypothetical protein
MIPVALEHFHNNAQNSIEIMGRNGAVHLPLV